MSKTDSKLKIKDSLQSIYHKIGSKIDPFLIFDFRLIFLFIVVSYAFVQFPLPNFVIVSSTLTASTLLTTIIGALSSILGVLIAVILLAFNILRKNYNKYAFRIFFKDKNLSLLVTFYILTIILSYLTLITLSDPLKFQSTNLVELSIISFVISLCMLFPLSSSIISSTQSKEKIEKIVNQIDGDTVQVYKFRRDIMASYSNYKIEENPIFILNELSERTLKDGDWLTSILILEKCQNKLFKLLVDFDKQTDNNKYTIRSIINVFLIVLKTISYGSIKTNKDGTLTNVFRFIENLHIYCSENKVIWHNCVELNYFIKNILEELLINKSDNNVRLGLKMVSRIMQYHLEKNIPSDEEILELRFLEDKNVNYEHYDTSKNLQWLNVSDEYIKIISEITKKAIELGNDEIIDEGLSNLLEIIVKTLDMPSSELTILQKQIIVRNCCRQIDDLISFKSDKGVYGGNFAIEYFTTAIEKAIELEEKILIQIMFTYAHVLIVLIQGKMMDQMLLNELGTLGRKFTKEIDNNSLYKKSLIFIITTFDKLKESVEEDITNNNLLYLEICEQVYSIKTWMKKENKQDKEVDQLIEYTLSSFTDYEDIKNNVMNNNITLIWPSLEKE